MRVIALLCIVCGCLFVYGFLVAERVKISTREDKATGFDVIVTLPNVTPNDRWIEVYGCAAEFIDDVGFRCTEHWERRSTQEPRVDQRQYVFPWGKYVPRGPMIIICAVFDEHRVVRLSGETRVLR